MNEHNLGIRPRIHPEVLEEIKELLDDGITITNAANYVGLSWSTVAWHFDPKFRKSHELAVTKWVENNKDRKKKNMADYQKQVREKLKYEVS